MREHHPNVPDSISVQTARCWLHKLDFDPCSTRKGIYQLWLLKFILQLYFIKRSEWNIRIRAKTGEARALPASPLLMALLQVLVNLLTSLNQQVLPWCSLQLQFSPVLLSNSLHSFPQHPWRLLDVFINILITRWQQQATITIKKSNNHLFINYPLGIFSHDNQLRSKEPQVISLTKKCQVITQQLWLLTVSNSQNRQLLYINKNSNEHH